MTARSALAAVFLILAGCVGTPSGPPRQGPRAVLASAPNLFLADTASPWLLERDGAELSISAAEGFPALRIENGKDRFRAARPTDSILQVTPYLTWSWNMAPHHGSRHPIQLIVGFRGGRTDGEERGGDGSSWFGDELPRHDRLLRLAWSDSNLKRGNLAYTGGDAILEPVRYIVRGGRENEDRWWRETVDLEGLYRRSWPHDAPEQVRVVFVGFAADGGKPPAAGFFSGLTLSR